METWTMGKQVKRVPLNFNWPQKKTWWGYELPDVTCQTCSGLGTLSQFLSREVRDNKAVWRIPDSARCPSCDGKGTIRPMIEIPSGPGYQLWDMLHNWRPISPVFAAPEDLAHWLSDWEISAYKIYRLSSEKWLEFILEKNELLGLLIKSNLEEYDIRVADRGDECSTRALDELFRSASR